MKRIITYLIISISTPYLTIGQSLDSLIAVSENLYQNTEAYLDFPVYNHMFSFDEIQTKDSTTTHYNIALKKAQQKALINNIGLAFKANAQYNFNGDLDEETNTFTNSRIKTEIEWNILKGGFLSNRKKAQQLENEITILGSEKERKQKVTWRRQFRLQYTYSINQELISLLTKKRDFLHHYFDVIAQLYAQSRIKREEFIKLSQSIITTETELNNTLHFNAQIKDSITTSLSLRKLPLLEVTDIRFRESKLFKQQQTNDSLRAQNTLLQYHWSKNIQLAAYLNYNWLQTTINNRDFASVGLRLSVPLRLSNTKEITKATIAKDAAFYQNKMIGADIEFTTFYKSYREKIRDLKNQYKNWQIIEERKRVLCVLKQDLKNNISGIQQLSLQATQFEILENTLYLKMQLYNALSHLYELDEACSIQPLIFETTTQPEVYVNQSTIYNTTFQIAFAKAKNIQKVHLATTQKAIINQWQAAGFNIQPINNSSSFIKLNEWIATEYKQLKTGDYESIFISAQSSSYTHTKRTKNQEEKN